MEVCYFWPKIRKRDFAGYSLFRCAAILFGFHALICIGNTCGAGDLFLDPENSSRPGSTPNCTRDSDSARRVDEVRLSARSEPSYSHLAVTSSVNYMQKCEIDLFRTLSFETMCKEIHSLLLQYLPVRLEQIGKVGLRSRGNPNLKSGSGLDLLRLNSSVPKT